MPAWRACLGSEKFLGILSEGSDVEPSNAKAGPNPSVIDPMIAKARRRRTAVLSTVTPADAATRIPIPSRHPAASRSFHGARDTDDLRHLYFQGAGGLWRNRGAFRPESRLARVASKMLLKSNILARPRPPQARSSRSRAPVSLTSRA